VSPIPVAAIAFVLTFGCAIAATFVREWLPPAHLSKESRDVVRLGIGPVATMTALLLRLVTAPAPVEDIENQIIALTPQTDAQRWFKTAALKLSEDVVKARWRTLGSGGVLGGRRRLFDSRTRRALRRNHPCVGRAAAVRSYATLSIGHNNHD
jgi:hypothetical protein